MIEIKDFIKQHSTELEPLMTEHKFDEIYKFLGKESSHLIRPKFTEFMLSMNINPLNYMTKIPSYYLAENSTITTLDIPNNISEIDEYAIIRCKNLITVIIPKSITSIGDYAIYECDNIRQVRNLSSVSTTWAFKPKLSETCEIIKDNSKFKSKIDIISDCLIFTYGSNKSLLTCRNKNIQSIKDLPSDIDTICDKAFERNRDLTYIELPNDLVKIGSHAFYWTNLESINLPLSLKDVGERAFDFCDNLTDLYYDGTRDTWIDINWGYDAIPLSCKKHFKE